MRRLLATGMCLFLLAACGGDDDLTSDPPPVTTTTESTSGELRLKRFELQCPEDEIAQLVQIDYAQGAGSNDPEQALRVYLLDKTHLPAVDEFFLALQRPNRADFIHRDSNSHVIVIARANRLPGGWVIGSVESCTGAGEEPVVEPTGDDAFDG